MANMTSTERLRQQVAQQRQKSRPISLLLPTMKFQVTIIALMTHPAGITGQNLPGSIINISRMEAEAGEVTDYQAAIMGQLLVATVGVAADRLLHPRLSYKVALIKSETFRII